MVKNLPANAEDIRDTCSIPGQGRLPREGQATHSCILAWRIPRTEEPGGLQSMELQTDTTEATQHAYIIHSSLNTYLD